MYTALANVSGKPGFRMSWLYVKLRSWPRGEEERETRGGRGYYHKNKKNIFDITTCAKNKKSKMLALPNAAK